MGEFDGVALGVIGRVMDGLNAYCGDGFLLDFHPQTRRAIRIEAGLDQRVQFPKKKKKEMVVKPRTVEEEVGVLKRQIKEIERKTGMRLSHRAPV